MLIITQNAVDAIKAVVSSSELPDQGGLRISAAPSQNGRGTALSLELAEQPAVEDAVVEEEGAHVFLEPQAAAVLDDAFLDAEVEGGAVRFAVGQQPAGGEPEPGAGA